MRLRPKSLPETPLPRPEHHNVTDRSTYKRPEVVVRSKLHLAADEVEAEQKTPQESDEAA